MIFLFSVLVVRAWREILFQLPPSSAIKRPEKKRVPWRLLWSTIGRVFPPSDGSTNGCGFFLCKNSSAL